MQTLPLYLLYTAILGGLLLNKDGVHFTGWTIFFVSAHAFWEIISEIYVIYHLGPLYKVYHEDKHILPRLIFGVTMSALIISGWIVLFP